MAQSLVGGPEKRLPADEVIGLAWRKSMRSIGNGQCVEAAKLTDGRLALRDSTDKYGPIILFTPGEWHTLLKGIKSGGFGNP